MTRKGAALIHPQETYSHSSTPWLPRAMTPLLKVPMFGPLRAPCRLAAGPDARAPLGAAAMAVATTRPADAESVIAMPER
jgi:hypothetical protein